VVFANSSSRGLPLFFSDWRLIACLASRSCSAGGEERYVGTGVSGWLDLGENWQPYLSTTKDAFDDAPLFDVLMGQVFEPNVRPVALSGLIFS